MTKVSLFTVLSVALSFPLYAQLQIGVRAGVHASSVNHRKGAVADPKLVPGYAIAVPVQIPFEKRWAIRVEPTLIQKGWQSKADYTTDLGQPAGTGRMVVRYHVVELPLLVSFRQKTGDRVSWYGLAGPSVGYVLGGNLRLTNGKTEIFKDKMQLARRIETGIWVGGGVELPFGNRTAFVDARYQYGVGKAPWPLRAAASREATHGFTVSVGCWLPVKK
ncbi:porin family protein [Larkinella bovis]|uniref:Porin family protein n=1 Tax=Larkinella bovis TaxID=683041 RepID=A0ABW0IB91_9BACT